MEGKGRGRGRQGEGKKGREGKGWKEGRGPPCVSLNFPYASTPRFNFYQWCKTPSSAFSKQISASTAIFCRFSVEP